MQVIYYTLFVLFITGLVVSRGAKKLHLPNVTAFLFAGLLIGPYALKLVSADMIEEMEFVSEIALGLIAYLIGSEFKLSFFKRVGLTPIVIALCEASMATILVVVVVVAFGFPLPLALVLGAIAAATAPAATVMVIKQYKARGPVTENLLSVVAIDDAIALIIFGINAAIARTLVASNFSFVSLLAPLIEIGGSLLVGGVLGIGLTFGFKQFASRGNRLTLLVAFVVLGLYLSIVIHGSALLLVMMMSAVVTNLYDDNEIMLEQINRFTPPVFMLFFVLSGAHLNIRLLPTVGFLGIIYLIMRVVGKVSGAYLGATLMKAPDNIKKYLGPSLIPQAGVAIGLSYVAQGIVPMYAPQIQLIILCATLIYELIGPVTTKWTLQQAGEIKG